MKIICIFAEEIYSIILPEHEDDWVNEFDRFLELWWDIEYLKSFFEENKGLIIGNEYLGDINTVHDFIKAVSDEVQELESVIEESAEEGTLDELFEYLHGISHWKRKEDNFKKLRINILRFYSIKIETAYLLTGGAIKITEAMQDHEDTSEQLERLRKVNEFLIEEGIHDKESLEDFINLQ